ncbi:MAG TPA: hypothetical protein VGG57_19880 [Stellaceae bacterium]
MNETTLKTIELPASLNDLASVIDRRIRSFLNGDDNGQELLAGLYGDIVDEPIPARLTTLLRR